MAILDEVRFSPISRRSSWGSRRGAVVLASTLATVLLLLASPVHAGKVIAPTIEQLSRGCDAIVIAKVDAVLGSRDIHPCWAVAQVDDVWKGNENLKSVQYLISSPSHFDVSNAKLGETVLLFLKKAEKGTGWTIYWSGQGRMPIQIHEGKEYATFYNRVDFPDKAKILRYPKDEQGFTKKAIELTDLLNLVNESLKSKN